MKILAITNLYPRPGRPHEAAYNRQQFAALAEEHEVVVVAPVPWTERITLRREYAGVRFPIERDEMRVYHPTFFFPPRILQSEYGRFFLASVRGTVNLLIREFRPDAILASWSHPDGWAAMKLARAAGLPVFIKVVGSDVLVITKEVRRRARVAEALREADGVLAVSRDLAEHVVRLGVNPDRVHVVYEGTNLELFRPGDRDESRRKLGLPAAGQTMVFVGHLKLSKGAGVLVEACRLLRDRGVAFRCYLVGRGPDEGTLRRMVAEHGLENFVELTGPRPQADLPDWYRSADVVVLPSFSEGIPNVLREAVACGRPFVATKVGGIPEITREPAGRLVSPGDPAGLADALQEMFTNPPKPEDMDPSVNISLQQSAGLLAEHLRKAVSSRRNAHPAAVSAMGS